MPDDVNRASFGRVRSVVNWLFSLRNTSARARSWLLALSAALFLVVSAVSFRSLAGQVEMHWGVLPILVLVTSPLTLVANTAEFRSMGQINGHRIGWLDAARLTVAAAAANLLPLPGGIVIRTQALHRRGSSYRHAFAANGIAGLIWIGCASIAIAALSVHDVDDRAAGWAVALLVMLAIGCLGGAAYLLRLTRPRDSSGIYLGLLGIEAGTVLISGARIYFAFRLIGLTASASQAIALTAAQIVAAAVGIFPGGLGLREALAGAIGALVHLGAGPAVAATAADRVIGQVSLALMGGILILLRLARPNDTYSPGGEIETPPQLHDTP